MKWHTMAEENLETACGIESCERMNRPKRENNFEAKPGAAGGRGRLTRSHSRLLRNQPGTTLKGHILPNPIECDH
jgi:hypothetical protein